MLTCYFDEAGGEDHGFIIVSGFVSTVAQWQQYEYDWKLMLAKYDVPYLHMKEISQFKGPFAEWKNALGTRSQFLACATGIISDRAQHAFSHYVDCKAFDRLGEEYPIKQIASSPYALAAMGCITQSLHFRERTSGTVDIECIFEEKGPDVGGLMTTIQKRRPHLPFPIFKPGRNTPVAKGLIQLQAADYLAYEMRKYIVDNPRYMTGERIPRKSLLSLTKGVEHKWVFQGYKDLKIFCQEVKSFCSPPTVRLANTKRRG